MSIRSFWLMLLLTCWAMPLDAQSNREKAVAIDRVPLAPAERLATEQIGPALASPWSLAFLPDGRFLISEKHGGLRIVSPDGWATDRLDGTPPNVFAKVDSGLLDVVLDPDFMRNQMIYLAFAEGNEQANRTAIWKARLERDRLVEGRVIFRVNESKAQPSHPGGRLLFLEDGTLLLTVGDGFDLRDKAQDPASHLGKVLRLDRDGRAPRDNPFVGKTGYAPEIFTLGHRNIQGLAYDPVTKTIWSHEHGPRGGDEINVLTAGRNYGWPRASFGIDYDGSLITDRQHIEGSDDPRFVWSPSIAPSGLAMYHGTRFPQWQGKLMVGGLATRSLVIVRVGDKGLLREERRVLGGLERRIRDVRVSPAGDVFVLTDEAEGALLRVHPADDEGTSVVREDIKQLVPLLGRWRGTSRITRPFKRPVELIDETSEIECLPTLSGRYIRCRATFRRSDTGSVRIVDRHVNATGKPGGALNNIVLTDNWPGVVIYEQSWDERDLLWSGTLPTDVDGQVAQERVTDQLSADGRSLRHIEAVRLIKDSDNQWQTTFEWNWTRVVP
jgi:aldose sugar dehydrogenase